MADEQIQAAVIRHAMRDMAEVPTASHDAPEPAGRKFGEGHLMGMVRLGGHELTQALQAFPDSNIRPMEEPGTVGNPTPQVVTNDMGYQQMLDSYAPSRTPVVQKETERER